MCAAPNNFIRKPCMFLEKYYSLSRNFPQNVLPITLIVVSLQQENQHNIPVYQSKTLDNP
jgi:hypothetical protein